MPHLFRPASQDLIREALEASVTSTTSDNSIKDIRDKIKSDRNRIRLAYDGGPDAVRMLIKKDGETMQSWKTRQHHFRNVRFVRYIVEQHARLLYGMPPKRQAWVGDKPPDVASAARAILSETEGDREENAVDEVAAWYTDIYESNFHKALMMRGADTFIKDGRAPLKVWVDEEGLNTGGRKPVRMDFFLPEDAIPIMDPDDPDIVLGVVETRVNGKDERRRLWNFERWDWVDDGLNVTEEGGEHGLGRVPWAFLGDGTLWLDDAVLIQARLINLDSANHAVARAQGFPVPVIKGKLLNQVENRDGEKGIPMNWDQAVQLVKDSGEDMDPDFYFAQPNAQLDMLQRTFNAVLQEGLKTHDLPDDLTSQSGGTEQPMTISLRWLNALSRRDQFIGLAEHFEDDVADLIARVIDAHFIPFNLDEFDNQVTFPKNPLPADERADERQDREKVTAGLMLREDYLSKWTIPDGSPAEVADYSRALDEAESKGTEAQAARVGEPFQFDLGVAG